VAAEWDHGGTTDSTRISETGVATAENIDAYDIDPDIENYAAGNNPETAYRDQGNPDSPNGWSSYASEDVYEETGLAEGDDYGDVADQYTELDEPDGPSESPDLWGDTDPDAANYPGPDGQSAASPDERESPDHGEPTPARDVGADTDQRISVLEAEKADTTQKLAEAEQKIANLEAKNEALTARLDRFEQLFTQSGHLRETASAHEQADDEPVSSADQPKARDAASAKYDAAIAEREDSRHGIGVKEAKHYGWRRVASSDNVGIASGVAGVADSLAQLTMHVPAEGVIGLGVAALGLAAAARAKAEKSSEKKKGKA
jgi:hypothetical protein